MFVKPNAGLQVRDPVLKDLLPPQGREVDSNDLYWHRRLRDKDVILVAHAMEEKPVSMPQKPAPPRRHVFSEETDPNSRSS